MLYSACENNKLPQRMTPKQFINQGLQFVQHLTAHHGIEETYFFPVLAERMPEFRPAPKGKGSKSGASTAVAEELLNQHKQIHAGMDVFEAYLEQCYAGKEELDLATLKAKMDTWGEVLWKHLDQEVKTLGAENVRKYYTLDEIKRIMV